MRETSQELRSMIVTALITKDPSEAILDVHSIINIGEPVATTLPSIPILDPPSIHPSYQLSAIGYRSIINTCQTRHNTEQKEKSNDKHYRSYIGSSSLQVRLNPYLPRHELYTMGLSVGSVYRCSQLLPFNEVTQILSDSTLHRE